MMRQMGPSWLAAQWIASKVKPLGHSELCQCSECRDAVAALFMQHLLDELDKARSRIVTIEGAMSRAIRAYRDGLAD